MLLTTSFFTTSLSLLKSTVVSNLEISNLSTFLFKLLQSFSTFSYLSVPNLSISDFKLALSAFFLAKHDVSTPVALLKSDFFCEIRQI